MTFNVYYTDRAQPVSSLVKRAWYDETSSRLALELHGAIYEYTGVPEFAYESLVDSKSPGGFYGNNIKPNYGPGSRLGPVSDLREMRVNRDSEIVIQARHSAGYPPVADFQFYKNGGLSIAKVPTPQLSLVKDVDTKPVTTIKSEYKVYFVIDGSDEEKTTSFTAVNEDDALEQMFDLADLLDQTVDVKGLSVRFE